MISESVPVYNKIYISDKVLKNISVKLHSVEGNVIPVPAFYLLKEAETLNYFGDWKRLTHKPEQKAPGVSIETACV